MQRPTDDNPIGPCASVVLPGGILVRRPWSSTPSPRTLGGRHPFRLQIHATPLTSLMCRCRSGRVVGTPSIACRRLCKRFSQHVASSNKLVSECQAQPRRDLNGQIAFAQHEPTDLGLVYTCQAAQPVVAQSTRLDCLPKCVCQRSSVSVLYRHVPTPLRSCPTLIALPIDTGYQSTRP
jgi:hypothetical protein